MGSELISFRFVVRFLSRSKRIIEEVIEERDYHEHAARRHILQFLLRRGAQVLSLKIEPEEKKKKRSKYDAEEED